MGKVDGVRPEFVGLEIFVKYGSEEVREGNPVGQGRVPWGDAESAQMGMSPVGIQTIPELLVPTGSSYTLSVCPSAQVENGDDQGDGDQAG